MTVKRLKDIVDQRFHDSNNLYKNYWYEFDAVQSEIIRTYSDTCKEFKEDEKTIFIMSSSSIVDEDGNTLHFFNYYSGYADADFDFVLKQMKHNHFAIRFSGVVL